MRQKSARRGVIDFSRRSRRRLGGRCLQRPNPVVRSVGAAGMYPQVLSRCCACIVAQQCFGLLNESIEDALYDSRAILRFVGMDLERESAPDATSLLKFSRLIEDNKMTETIYERINQHLAAKGLMMREGTVVDATIIAAPSSTTEACGSEWSNRWPAFIPEAVLIQDTDQVLSIRGDHEFCNRGHLFLG